MTSFDLWLKQNRFILDNLYYSLIAASKKAGIIIIQSDDVYENFLIMMYNESNKKIVDKDDFPDLYYKMYNSSGYEKYKIVV
jgi:hypothetical protein